MEERGVQKTIISLTPKADNKEKIETNKKKNYALESGTKVEMLKKNSNFRVNGHEEKSPGPCLGVVHWKAAFRVSVEIIPFLLLTIILISQLQEGFISDQISECRL